MKEKPVITKVPDGYGKQQNPKWPVIVVFQVETDDGPLALRMTGAAAHQLRAMLDHVPPISTLDPRCIGSNNPRSTRPPSPEVRA